MDIQVRGDGIVQLRFDSVVGMEEKREACRLQTTLAHLQRMNDLLTKVIGHHLEAVAAASKKKAGES
jgi:hypothetical protein